MYGRVGSGGDRAPRGHSWIGSSGEQSYIQCQSATEQRSGRALGHFLGLGGYMTENHVYHDGKPRTA
eukprot:5547536-Pyramimonas_sp.AAC.1